MNLSNRTNRYFSFDIEGSMEKEVAFLEKKLKVGVGLVASWKDEMQVERYIEADSIVFIIVSLPPLYKRLIPIYSYTAFWDFGTFLQAEYDLIEWRKLHVLYSTKMLYFPRSQAFSIGLGLDLSLDF